MFDFNDDFDIMTRAPRVKSSIPTVGKNYLLGRVFWTNFESKKRKI